MSDWIAKRFWTEVNVIELDRGFAVQLDKRLVMTPAKATLLVPTRAMAEAVASEWCVVIDKINPHLMPVTRSANAAIDKVALQFNEVAVMLAAYGGSDLLCYRAENPESLVQRQIDGWDPLLDWAHEMFGVRLVSTTGIMPINQSRHDLAVLSGPLFKATHFELAALHDLIALSGSLIIALGVTKGLLSPADAWAVSRIDETWQAEQWGSDDDADQVVEIKRTAFMHAANFHLMASNNARG